MQELINNVTSKVDFDVVGPLPQKNIDTGMGLERVAFIKQGVENMYETDQVRPVLDRASELSGRRYGADRGDDVRMRIIADHVRSSLMLMSDGVTPSNEAAGTSCVACSAARSGPCASSASTGRPSASCSRPPATR